MHTGRRTPKKQKAKKKKNSKNNIKLTLLLLPLFEEIRRVCVLAHELTAIVLIIVACKMEMDYENLPDFDEDDLIRQAEQREEDPYNEIDGKVFWDL